MSSVEMLFGAFAFALQRVDEVHYQTECMVEKAFLAPGQITMSCMKGGVERRLCGYNAPCELFGSCTVPLAYSGYGIVLVVDSDDEK